MTRLTLIAFAALLTLTSTTGAQSTSLEVVAPEDTASESIPESAVASPLAQCVPGCRRGYICSGGVCVSDPSFVTSPAQIEPAQTPGPAPIAAPVPTSPLVVPAPEVLEPDLDAGILPRAFTERPLTLPRGTLSSDVGFGLSAFRHDFSDTDYFTSMAAAVAFGAIDALTIRLKPLRFGLTPDFLAFDPLLSVHAAFVRGGTFQIGASYALRLPLADDGSGPDNTLSVDFLVRSRVFRFSASLFFEFIVSEEASGGDAEGGSASRDVSVGSGITTDFGFQLAPIFAINLGLVHYVTDFDGDRYRFSLAPSFIFTIPKGASRSPLMDIGLSIFVPGILGTGRSDAFDASRIQTVLNFRFYTDLY